MESKELSIIKELEKNLKPLIKGNILDFIVFGSLVKGKHKPKDLDIVILVRNEEEMDLNELSQIRKKIKKTTKKVDTEVMDPLGFYLTGFGFRVFMEGYSILKGEFIYEGLDINPYNIYSYSLKKLGKSKKTTFNRSLKKILKEIGGEKIGRGVIKVPRKDSGKVEDIFKRWNVWNNTKTLETFIH